MFSGFVTFAAQLPELPEDKRDTLALFSLLGFGIGVGVFFNGFRRLRKYRVLADTPRETIRGIPMGLVRVRGQAEGDEHITSPVSYTPCFWYKVVIEHFARTAQGDTQWFPFFSVVDGVTFYLADRSGRVKIDARRADLELVNTSLGRKSGASQQEQLQYVTKVGVHWYWQHVVEGLERSRTGGSAGNQEENGALDDFFQSTSDTPEAHSPKLPWAASIVRQRLTTLGTQTDPQLEQARQAFLEALNHKPGSRNFVETLEGRGILRNGIPEAIRQLRAVLDPAADVTSFHPAEGEYHLAEFCLVPGSTYAILGTSTENPAPKDENDRNLIHKGQHEPTFLITWMSGAMERSYLRQHALTAIYGGAILAIASATAFLACVGWLF